MTIEAELGCAALPADLGGVQVLQSLQKTGLKGHETYGLGHALEKHYRHQRQWCSYPGDQGGQDHAEKRTADKQPARAVAVGPHPGGDDYHHPACAGHAGDQPHLRRRGVERQGIQRQRQQHETAGAAGQYVDRQKAFQSPVSSVIPSLLKAAQDYRVDVLRQAERPVVADRVGRAE